LFNEDESKTQKGYDRNLIATLLQLETQPEDIFLKEREDSFFKLFSKSNHFRQMFK